MPPKRKSDVLLEEVDAAKQNDVAEAEGRAEGVLSAKQPRIADSTDAPSASSSKVKKGKARSKDVDDANRPKCWKDVVLEGIDEDDLPIYDDCNDIRRKIRALLQEPDFKVTNWLREIGNINNNSYQRFMKASGPTGGAENGTYYAAYVYFEKKRIFEGKKKTAKRIRMENETPEGQPLRDARRTWVYVPR
ncbi:hypothetical protein BDY19DRAFT_988855 [Irpex rosettiformis]|uniref:Uncharacterized protein n=1 Tax=Irpex rosettiformis TaxID=378272 RepID=A0ACB8ULQ0_9APHY|nr:hypothetical protein BDY19DRAFT_988855 [Irpex rosettiformis]